MEKLRAMISQAQQTSGVSFDEIARSLECSVDELIAFDSGHAGISAEVLFGLVNVLNISPEQVMPLLNEDFRRQAQSAVAIDESSFFPAYRKPFNA